MAYATYSDVQSEFKSITFSGSTSITDSEVTTFIAQADAEINGCVGKIYRVPIIEGTSPEAFALLKAICVSIVADRVSGILRNRTVKKESDQEAKTGVNSVWGRMMLNKIKKGDVLLLDASGNEIERANSDGGVTSFNVDNDIEHGFKRDVNQW